MGQVAFMPYLTHKLIEVCDVVYGFAFKANKFNEVSNGLPVIRIGDIDKEKTDKFFNGKYDKKYIINRGDILLGLSGSFKANRWQGKKALLNQRVATLRNFGDKTAERFVFYQLPKLLKNLERSITQLSVKNILTKHLDSLKILYPPLEIQKQIVERLDKIAEAQKLNDGLIQKAEELFQSLLHKEFNPAGKDWGEDKFVNCIEKNPLKIKGIPREKYQSVGKFPIIDQSDKFIVGYTDNEDKVYKIDYPVIIFGDHTRIFKYVDFNFAIGADGTQIIIPNAEKFIPKFFYFSMLSLKINNLGYSRHFKLLKTKKLIIPPLQIQKQIVAKLYAVQDYKSQLLAQKLKLKELFNSVLAKSFIS